MWVVEPSSERVPPNAHVRCANRRWRRSVGMFVVVDAFDVDVRDDAVGAWSPAEDSVARAELT